MAATCQFVVYINGVIPVPPKVAQKKSQRAHMAVRERVMVGYSFTDHNSPYELFHINEIVFLLKLLRVGLE